MSAISMPVYVAYADDAQGMSQDLSQDLNDGVKCKPVKSIIKRMRKLEGMDADIVDTVTTSSVMSIKTKDEGPLPDAVFFRNKGVKTAFTIADDGKITDFKKIAFFDKKGEFCIQDKRYFGKTKEQTKGIFSVSLSLDVAFKDAKGLHTLDKIRDGLKDGKSHYKKMFPTPLKLMIPKMTHIGVAYKDNENGRERKDPEIFAVLDDMNLSGLQMEYFSAMYIIAVEDLQTLGADSLKITGGDYTLYPLPGIEKMKKFGFVDKEKGGEEKMARKSE